MIGSTLQCARSAQGKLSSANDSLAVSVCICTRNRPESLRAAIQSVLRSSVPAHDIVVSDDSTDYSTRLMLAMEFADALASGKLVLTQGPKTGLGANRNNALAHARGRHVLFIDDDVLLGEDFIAKMAAFLSAGPGDPARLLVTGCEVTHGELVLPHKLTFMGHQALNYTAGEARETIVINATLFPRDVFAHLQFDENLVYGCDEVDFAMRAVCLHGFRIALAPLAVNHHFPSAVNRDYYAPFVEASRIYVTYKRYRWIERSRLKAACYLALAYTHVLLHGLKTRGLGGFTFLASTWRTSRDYIRACDAAPARHV